MFFMIQVLDVPADHAGRAFAVMAPYYDAFTAHHDYELWFSGLERLLAAHGLRGRRALDLACGTGKSLEPLLRRGYEVTACDVSAEMLGVARSKFAGTVRFHDGDVRALPELGQFDLITCLDDITNYLVDPDELVALCRGIARNLAPGGLAVFDANTLWTFRSFFGSTAVVEETDLFMAWRGDCAPSCQPGVLATAALDIFVREASGRWTHELSHHVERHHPETVLREAASRGGLEVLQVSGMYPDVTFDPDVDEERHNKAIYVVKAAGSFER